MNPDVVSVVESLRDQVAERNGALNALVTLRPWEDVLAELDAKAGHPPLCGLPFTVKDTFDLAGVRSTAGSTRLADRVPEENAAAISRMITAGGAPFAKSNVPSMAGDLVTENRLFGRTDHPDDARRTPGGSSGGGATAVAAGMTPLDLCSDMGGSARLPAHYCGVFGHKLTFGLCPLTGHVPPLPGCSAPRDLACVGVLAATASVLSAAVQALATGNGGAPPGPPWRVAAWLSDPFLVTPAAHVAVMERALHAFEARTGSVVDVLDRPADIGLEEYDELFRVLLASAAGRLLGDDRFRDGVAVAQSLTPGDRSPFAVDLRASAILHRDWLLVDERRHALRSRLVALFDRYDALVCPVSPVLAPFHPVEADRYRRVTDDGCDSVDYFSQMTWSGPASIAYLPATVAPIGRVHELPLGLQIVGPPHADQTTIAIAGAVADVAHGSNRALGRSER